jgi:hypothetical protein
LDGKSKVKHQKSIPELEPTPSTEKRRLLEDATTTKALQIMECQGYYQIEQRPPNHLCHLYKIAVEIHRALNAAERLLDVSSKMADLAHLIAQARAGSKEEVETLHSAFLCITQWCL